MAALGGLPLPLLLHPLLRLLLPLWWLHRQCCCWRLLLLQAWS
jgi:hypothetical protein